MLYITGTTHLCLIHLGPASGHPPTRRDLRYPTPSCVGEHVPKINNEEKNVNNNNR
jgi:hypothetical protein